MSHKIDLIQTTKNNQSYFFNKEQYFLQDEKKEFPYNLKGQVILKMRSNSIGFVDEQIDNQFLEVFYIVNDQLLYFMKQDFDYQNIIKSIELKHLFDFETNKVKNIGEVFKLDNKYCFKIKHSEITFKLCQLDKATSSALHLALINQILRLFHQAELAPAEMKCGRYQSIDYSFKKQSVWGCNCQNTLQSPIMLSQLQANWVDDDRLFFVFNDISCIRYARINQVIQYFGELGTIVHRQVTKLDEDRNITVRYQYEIYKMVIRIKGEHEILGFYEKYNDMSQFHSEQEYRAKAVDSMETFGLEIEFYAWDQNHNECIISVGGQKQEGMDFNRFLENLNLDQQDYQDEKVDSPFIDNNDQQAKLRSLIFLTSPENKEILPNLWQLFPEYFNLSFFYYMGSDTMPPCTGNIKHIVLKYPILIPPAQMLRFRDKLIESDQYSNRLVQKIEEREIYYHNEAQCIEPKKPPKQFIKLTQKYTTYGLGEKNGTKFEEMFKHHGEQPINLREGDVKVSSVKEEQIDETTRQILTDKYMFKIKGSKDYNRLVGAKAEAAMAQQQLKSFDQEYPEVAKEAKEREEKEEKKRQGMTIFNN